MMKQLLFLHIFARLALVSGQQTLNFTVVRSPTNANHLIFLCESDDDGRQVVNPVFFRDGSILSIPNATSSFVIDRSLEGDYSCGTADELGNNTSTGEFWIVLVQGEIEMGRVSQLRSHSIQIVVF